MSMLCTRSLLVQYLYMQNFAPYTERIAELALEAVTRPDHSPARTFRHGH